MMDDVMDDVTREGSDISPHRPARRLRHALALACLVLLTACKSDLYTQLPETDANEMMSVLIRSDIAVDRALQADGTYTLRVETERMADAIDALRASGYPKNTYRSMGDVFAGNGFILSPMEEKARMVYALSEELSRTVSDIDGIVTARVHVVLPNRDMLSQNASPASASVFIRHDPAAPIAGMTPQIKMLVANSIEGLTYERVSVVPFAVTGMGVTAPPALAVAADAPDGASAMVAAAPASSGGLPGWLILPIVLAYMVWVGDIYRRSRGVKGTGAGAGPSGASSKLSSKLTPAALRRRITRLAGAA